MQTASQIMAAKKQAKQQAQIAKQAKQTIGAGYTGDRNRTAAIKHRQMKYRYEMQKGRPFDYETNLNETIKNLLHYQTLVYQTDAVSLTVFEKLIRAMKIIAQIYTDQDLAACARAAETALDKSRQPEAEDYSPNQRRTLLRPVLELCSWAEAYGEIVPAATVSMIGCYCSAVQVALYTTAFYSQPKGLVYALYEIISGRANFRDLAKQAKVKEPAYRANILDTAWLFYRIIECFVEVEPPQSITDLKQAAWKPYGDHNTLQASIRRIINDWLIPFETHTGIQLIDYHQFRKDCVEIESRFLSN